MSDYFDRIERQLVDRVRPAPRRVPWPARSVSQLVPAAAAVVAIAVVAVFAGLASRGGSPSPATHPSPVLAFTAVGAGGGAPPAASLKGAVAILRRRLHAELPGVRVSRTGDRVTLSGVTGANRARAIALTAPGVLRFYDWEADTLTPAGRSVAVGIVRQDPAALVISQGTRTGPGAAGAGSLSLYQAVRIAARSAPWRGTAPVGATLYLFGRPGSPACATAARDRGETIVAGVHCLLAGPTFSAAGLRAQLPAGVALAQGQRLTDPAGIILLQAAGTGPGGVLGVVDPAGQFFVLIGRPVPIINRELTSIAASTDAGGQPDVTFSFTPSAARAFTAATRTIARRGSALSTTGNTFDQHFAIALDGRLVTVPSIDFRAYPDGIQSGNRADISGGFTARGARDLAALLRFGPLAVRLVAR